jgi:hypothetical protein
MIQLQKNLQGQPRIAKQVMEHLPGKTAKQIRDNRKEPSYKAHFERHTTWCSTTPDPLESRRSSSDSEIEIRPVPRRRYVSDTDDDQGEVTRQPSPSSQVTGETSPARETSPSLERQPGLKLPTGEWPSHNKGASDTTSCDDRAIRLQDGDSGDNPANETQWQTDVIRQALAETRENSTLNNRYRDFHANLVSTLNEMLENLGLTTQGLIDDLYTQVVKEIATPNAKRANKLKRAKGPKNHSGSKTKRKRYIYARTQELFRKKLISSQVHP